ncbi:MAG: site-2 protease family protein [Clostridia bacterium]|nr:site-2 protease family protein [Clostridia bacterium]
MNLSMLGIFNIMTVVYIVVAILVFLLMILIHELGHYTAGKILKFKINEFSIGFGKAIYSKTNKNGEKFSIRIFPIGGYCAFEGENEAGDKKNPQAFNNQKPWKRMIVLFSGAFFNFLSAIIFCFVLLVAFGFDIMQIKGNPTIYQDKLYDGDAIYQVDGTDVNFATNGSMNELLKRLDEGEEFSLTVKRLNTETGKNEMVVVDGLYLQHKLNSNIILYDDPISGLQYALDTNKMFTEEEYSNTENDEIYDTGGNFKEGISVFEDDEGNIVYVLLSSGVYDENEIAETTNTEIYYYIGDNPVYSFPAYGLHARSFWEALGQAFILAVMMAWVVLKALWMLITFQIPLSQIGGPVATISFIVTSTQTSIVNLFVLLPLISANLAMFNLLPFPALDGAQMVFTGVEWIRKKPINQKVQGMINMCGLIFLLGFVVIVDILHFIL